MPEQTPGPSVSSPFSQTAGYVLALAAVALIYFTVAKLSLALASIHPSATPIWPPTGVALASVLLLGYRIWPAIFLAAVVANATTAGSIYTSVAIGLGNTLESVAGAYLLDQWCGGRHTFDTPAGVAKFALISCAATMISPSVGVASLSLGGHASWSSFASIWMTWWMGDLGGALLVAPVIVLWANDPLPFLDRNEIVPSAAVLAVAIAVGVVAFSPLLEQSANRSVAAFMAIVPLMWAALRRNRRDTATVAFILAGFAVWGTMSRAGPFGHDDLNQSFLLLLAFVISISIPSLALSAEVAARQRAEADKRFLHDLSDDLRTLGDADAIMSTVAEALGRHLAASRAGYSEVNAAGDASARALWHAAHLSAVTGPYPLKTFGPSAVDELARGDTRVIENAETDQRTREFVATYRSIDTMAAITVPLVKDGRLRAALHVFQDHPRRWTPAEIALCQEIAERTWAAVGRAQAEGALLGEIAERKQREQHLEFVLQELSHRSRNLLAVVQSVARQTYRTNESYDEFETLFMSRIQALAQAHNLLLHHEWRGAMIEEVVTVNLDPINVDKSRIDIDGPPIMLNPSTAQNLGLAIHELVTNACKYGALANPVGQISISWGLDDGEPPRLRLTWQERGGPPVEVPHRRGFGTLVLSRMASSAVGGKSALEFAPEGLVWSVEVAGTEFTAMMGNAS